MGIKSFIAGGFFLLLSHSQAHASQVTVFGPQTLAAKMIHSHTVEFFFAGLSENSSSVVTLKMGDGTDLSPKSCGGKSLVLAKCKIENVLRGLEVFLTRPQSIDLSLNGQVLVSRTNYNAAAGTMLISTTTKVANSLKVLVKGLPTASASLVIQADNHAQQPLPVASFSLSPEVGIAPQTVVLNAMLSSSQGGVITSYEWDFGDGQFATGALVTHTFNSSGVFAVKLTVTDNVGQKSTISKNLSLTENLLPVAGFSFVSDGLNVTFDASTSTDSDGSIVSYEWSFGDSTSSQGKVVSHSYSQVGTFTVGLVVKDDKGGKHSITMSVLVTTPMPPTAKISLNSPSSGAAPMIVWFDSHRSSDPNQLPLTRTWDFGDGTQSSESGPLTHEFKEVGQYTVKLIVTNSNGLSESDQMTVNVVAVPLPQEPEAVAPPLTSAGFTSFGDASSFIYSGASPIQMSANIEIFDKTRAAVLSGKVLSESGTPVAGAKVSILNIPDYGYTLTRADGRYDLVVNGGGEVVLDFSRNGYLPSQRTLSPNILDYASAPDVVLVARDPKMTKVVLGPDKTGLIVAKGSTVTDSNGSRAAIMVIPANAKASLKRPDGTSIETSTLSLRATEYTVGPSGPEKMPGILPKTSAYMYAVDVSADEGTAIGAEHIQFDKPVSVYVNNFLGFAPGFTIPVGSYNFQKGYWEAAANGRVLKVLNSSPGNVELAIDSSGAVATASQLASLDMSAEELNAIGELFKAGDSFWRMRTTHFSPWDLNAPARPSISTLPNTFANSPIKVQIPQVGGTCANGSIIDINRQVLGEVIPVTGADFVLSYTSAQVPGRVAERTLWIPLLTGGVPQNLTNIHLQVEVAGQAYEEDFVPLGNLSKRFEWNGLDRYGRKVQGGAPVKVKIRYDFPQNYVDTGAEPFSFGRLLVNASTTGVAARQPATVEKNWETTLGSIDNSAVVGGWGVSNYHFYDAATRTLFYGHGGKEEAALSVGRDNRYILKYYSRSNEAGFAGDGGPVAAAKFNKPAGAFVAADGSLYVFDTGNLRIRRISKEGIVSTAAGTGGAGFSGDGASAIEAQISPSEHSQFAQDASGNIYFTDTNNHRIRKIDILGNISTVVGTGVAGVSPDNVLGVDAQIESPEGIAVSEGTLYFSDSKNNLVRAIDPQGRIYTVLNSQTPGISLNRPRALQVGPEKELYVMVMGALYIVRPTGQVSIFGGQTFVAATSSYYYGAPPFKDPAQFVVQKDRRIFVANALSNDIWVSSGSIIKNLTSSGVETENVFPNYATLKDLNGFDIGLDGSMYILDDNQIKIIQSILPAPSSGEVKIAEKNGEEIYVFSEKGLHLTTLNARTGSPLMTFHHTSEGLLSKIIDRNGLTTEFVRDSAGGVEKIISPFGYETTLSIDSNGFLKTLQDPLGNQYKMEYQSGGLLTKFIKPSGAPSVFTYDATGLLLTDTNAQGGFTDLVRTLNGSNATVSAKGALSAVRTASSLKTDLGGETVINISSSNIRSTHVAFENFVFTRKPTGDIHEYKMVDPYFAGLANYTWQKVDPIGGNISASVAYQKSGEGEFDYIKTTSFAPPNLGYFTSTYNATQRTESILAPNGIATLIQFDVLGRMTQIASGPQEPISMLYNSQGQVSKVTHGNRVTEYAYNEGLLASVRSPAGLVTTMEYDGAARLTAQTRPDGKVVRYEYDANGNMTSITPPGRPKHIFGYDLLDLVSSYLPPIVGGIEAKTQFAYDLESKLKEITRPDGSKIHYFYDTGGRLVRIATSEGDYVFTYHPTTGLIASYQSPSGVLTTLSGSPHFYSYDVTGPAPVNYTIYSKYQGSSFEEFYYRVGASSNYVNWIHDQSGNKYQDSSSLWLTRDTQTALIEKMEPGYVREKFSYNSFGELVLKSSEIYSIMNKSLLGLSYQRDTLGRITESSVNNQGVASSFSYEYDNLGRLVKVLKDGSVVENYIYDDNGNRVQSQVRGISTSYSYDHQDRLLSAGGKVYSYNANGELMGVAGAGDSKVFAYNAFGYLKSAQVGAQVIDYILDAKNNRVGKKVNGVLKQRFVYNAQGQIISEVNEAAQVRMFSYATHVNSPSAMVVGSERYYFVLDHVGSVLMVINTSTGGIMQELEYDAFGNVLKDTNPGFQPFGFAGGLYDHQTGLVRFGARDYDPEVGRWTSKDPILFNGQMTNLYGYSFNDPVNFVDTNGQVPVTVIWAGAGALAGGAGAFVGTLLGGGTMEQAYDAIPGGAIGGALAGAMAAPAAMGAAATAAGTAAGIATDILVNLANSASNIDLRDFANGINAIGRPKNKCPAGN